MKTLSNRVDEVPAYQDMLGMEGRHALVLGAGQGIGRQTAHALAAVGANVTCVDSDGDRAKAVAAEVGGLPLTGDVTDRATMERIFAESTAEFGRLNSLVDIVGIADWAPLREIDDDNWDRGISRNLRHGFLAIQLGAAAMGPEGGAMAFVASISGMLSAPNHAIYGAAKAGLMNLVSTAAVELGPGIRINAVSPGSILTPRMAILHDDEVFWKQQGELVPAGRTGFPRDIASALLYFVSDLSTWVTGQTLVVDGGMARKFPY